MTYNADNFLEKNRNFLPLEVIQMLRQSKYDIVRSQFQCPLTKTGNLYSASMKNNMFRIASPEISPMNYGIFGSKVPSRCILDNVWTPYSLSCFGPLSPNTTTPPSRPYHSGPSNYIFF